MAFNRDDLSLVSYSGNGFHIWHYKSTGDALNTIDTAGYFNTMVSEINVGDVIFVNASNGFGISTVNANDGSAIDTADIVSMTSDSR
tara:strand:+ start:1792 stop:2052 length:261 start_codon:yes stop_codon:yes gene_type:complete